jgi:hypothetical protein
MRRSAEWYRQQSERAMREYQHVVWGGHVAPREPQSAAAKIYPALHSETEWRTGTITRRKPQPVQGVSAASRIYPHLAKER